jgi:predicted DCC family thiol-disulfide oxidoreductase YuxK
LSLRAERHVLAYDDGCGPCSRFAAIVGFLDARRRIEFVPLETAAGSGLLDDLPPEMRFASFHLVAPHAPGTVKTGAVSGPEAILPLLRLLSPSGAVFSRAWDRIPGLRAALAFSYSALSRLHRGCPAFSGPRPSRSNIAETG